MLTRYGSFAEVVMVVRASNIFDATSSLHMVGPTAVMVAAEAM